MYPVSSVMTSPGETMCFGSYPFNASNFFLFFGNLASTDIFSSCKMNLHTWGIQQSTAILKRLETGFHWAKNKRRHYQWSAEYFTIQNGGKWDVRCELAVVYRFVYCFYFWSSTWIFPSSPMITSMWKNGLIQHWESVMIDPLLT